MGISTTASTKAQRTRSSSCSRRANALCILRGSLNGIRLHRILPGTLSLPPPPQVFHELDMILARLQPRKSVTIALDGPVRHLRSNLFAIQSTSVDSPPHPVTFVRRRAPS